MEVFELDELDMKILNELGEIEFLVERDISEGTRILIKKVERNKSESN